jgi:hypothetical protein
VVADTRPKARSARSPLPIALIECQGHCRRIEQPHPSILAVPDLPDRRHVRGQNRYLRRDRLRGRALSVLARYNKFDSESEHDWASLFLRALRSNGAFNTAVRTEPASLQIHLTQLPLSVLSRCLQLTIFSPETSVRLGTGLGYRAGPDSTNYLST